MLGPAGATDGRATRCRPIPSADERLAALRRTGRRAQPGESDRRAYLAAIDGMSVDDPARGGLRARRRPSCIRSCSIAFRAPRDFRLFNDHDGVLGVGRDRSLLYFSCTAGQVPGRLDDWMRNKLQPTPTDIQSTEIGGAEAAIGARPRGSDTGLGQVRYVIDPPARRRLLLQPAERRARPRPAHRRHGRRPTRSFHDLSLAEAAALRPYRLHDRAARRRPAGDAGRAHALSRLQAGAAAGPERRRRRGRARPARPGEDRSSLDFLSPIGRGRA